MILPILAYGWGLLRQRCQAIDSNFTNLDRLVDSLWQTMSNANGCGLAACQIGHPIRLFIVDSQTTYETLESPDKAAYFEGDDEGITETFINARIIDRSGREWVDQEGCLSLPGLSQPIARSWTITIEYQNRRFEKQLKTFHGLTARMIQHEYDHTEGILYLDYLGPLKRKLLEAKLKRIRTGRQPARYPMKFIS